MGDEKSKVLRFGGERVRVIPESIRFKDAEINIDIRQKIYRAFMKASN